MLIQKINNDRRQFIKSVLAGGIFVSGLTRLVPVYSQIPGNDLNTSDSRPRTEFDLTIAETQVNFTGTPRIATTINGSIPAPTLHWREGDTVTIRVTNQLAVDTSIHWHGILLPFQMDGVPVKFTCVSAIVSTEFQPLNAIVHVVTCSKKQHRDILACLTH